MAIVYSMLRSFVSIEAPLNGWMSVRACVFYVLGWCVLFRLSAANECDSHCDTRKKRKKKEKQKQIEQVMGWNNTQKKTVAAK